MVEEERINEGLRRIASAGLTVEEFAAKWQRVIDATPTLTEEEAQAIRDALKPKARFLRWIKRWLS